jgi:O-acetyl-ADP-ribose deacetylase (regulator of RNase III)
MFDLRGTDRDPGSRIENRASRIGRHPVPVSFVHGDILDQPADRLVSSGNVLLNMSGGVNGALMRKYGPGLQKELHDHLKKAGLESVAPGFCHRFEREIPPYKGVVYAVAIDAWYASSAGLVERTLETAIAALDAKDGETVVLPALATGYGNLAKAEFGRALRAVADRHPGIRFTLAERDAEGLEEVRRGFEGGEEGR